MKRVKQTDLRNIATIVKNALRTCSFIFLKTNLQIIEKQGFLPRFTNAFTLSVLTYGVSFHFLFITILVQTILFASPIPAYL